MKKIINLIFLVLVFICVSLTVNAESISTVYAPDGRTANVYSSDVQAWKNVGWYEYPVAAMYAPDGRVEIINRGSMQDWVNVGWFTYPVATVYAPDGRAEIISKDSVQDWINVGWYTYPVATLYAPDGRSIVVDKNTVNDWVSVGWYTYKPEASLPFTQPEEFYFSSGAGAWGTTLIVNPDGSFSGSFSDTNMGEVGPGYPHGTIYVCDFSGKFGNITKIDNYSYSMNLEDLTIYQTPGKEWISDKILYVASEAYGLDSGTKFILYQKGTPAYYMPQGFKDWWLDYRFSNNKPSALSGYGIYNVNGQYGFIN